MLPLPLSTAGAPEAHGPTSVLKTAGIAGAQGAGIGFFISAIQNALGNHSKGAMGVFTRTGGTIGFFTAMGVAFAGTEAVVRNAREQDDALNGAAGGCAAGFLIGLRQKSLPAAFGGCAVLAASMGLYDYSGSIAPTEILTREERRAKFFKKPPPTIPEVETASA